MTNNLSFDGDIHFAGDVPPSEVVAVSEGQPLFVGSQDRRNAAIFLGGSGLEVGLALKAAYAGDGKTFPSLYLDTDWTALSRALTTRSGQVVGFGATEVVAVGRGHSRDEIYTHPVQALRDLFVGDAGLLRDISVHEQFAFPGLGSHALRPVAALDFALDDRWPRRVRRLLRRWLVSAVPAAAGGDEWTALPAGEDEAVARPRIWLVASLAGSVGSAGLLLVAYLVQREARSLGVPEPVIYAVLLDPRLYAGLNDRVFENATATMEDLKAAFESGFEWIMPDGAVISAKTPPFWRVWCLGDPSAADEALVADESSLPAVPAGVRSHFFQRVATTLYLAMTTGALDDLERAAANAHPRPWGTMVGASADLDLGSLAPAVVAKRAALSLERAASTHDV